MPLNAEPTGAPQNHSSSPVAAELERLLRRDKPKPKTPHEIFEQVRQNLKDWQLDKNERLGALAHSRPALEIRAPAFFRHAMFFFPHDKEEKAPIMHPGDFRRYHALKKIATTLTKLAGTTFKSPLPGTDPAGRGLLGELAYRFNKEESFVWVLESFCGFSLRILIDIYSEYATITLVLDNHPLLSQLEYTRTPELIAKFIRDQIDGARAGIDWRTKRVFEDDYTSPAACFFGVWELLNHARGTRLSESGNMVGDFRGFSLVPGACEVGVDAEKTSKGGVKSNREDDIKYRFNPEGGYPEQNVMRHLEEHSEFFLGCLGLDSRGNVLHDSGGKRKRIEPNIILCRMLDGDAIYGSSLGSELTHAPRRVPHDYAPLPVTYFFIHNGQSHNQLGRMIRRQNLLEDLRIAALLDADLIVKLGSAVRRLSGLVSAALNDSTRGKRVDQRRFQEIVELYALIAQKCHGGFTYRMSRASYYYHALQQRLDDTRSKAIIGWQSYPGFIKRHFDQRFRSMRSVGERYQEVGERIQQLFNLYGTEGRHRSGFAGVAITSVVGGLTVGTVFGNWAKGRLDNAHLSPDIQSNAAITIQLLTAALVISTAFYWYLHPRVALLRPESRNIWFSFVVAVAIAAASVWSLLTLVGGEQTLANYCALVWTVIRAIAGL